MNYNSFLHLVQERGQLDNEDSARIAVEATLETLSERLYRTDRDYLAAQLPHELKPIFSHRHSYDTFTLEEFYTRVASRAGLRFPHGVRQARVVAGVLKEAVSEGQIEHILRNLPHEFREIFGTPPEGPLSPSGESPERPETQPWENA